jgi:hypothetical protein
VIRAVGQDGARDSLQRTSVRSMTKLERTEPSAKLLPKSIRSESVCAVEVGPVRRTFYAPLPVPRSPSPISTFEGSLAFAASVTRIEPSG